MIRPIRPDDVPALRALIRDLAEYELDPDAVEATEHDLHNALFAERPSVYAHVAVERSDGAGNLGGAGAVGDADGEVVGAAVWYLTFSTWTMRICTERGYARLDWEVLDVLADRDDRRGPHGFYLRQGGSPRHGGTPWRMDAEALSRAAGG